MRCSAVALIWLVNRRVLPIVWLGLLFVACSTRQPSPAPRPDTQFHQITIGLCEDYPEESRSLAAARNDLLLLKTNHIPVLRIAFGWDAMEPERGKYDWSFWDDFVRTANDYGVRLIPYICYTPKWASSDQGTNFWRAPPKDPQNFANFVSQLVQRYKGSIHTWELWNEPDNPAYWSGTVEDFAKLLKAGSHAVRATDPQAKVVSGGIAWNVDFLGQLFSDHQISEAIDIVNAHNYHETWSGDRLESIFDYVNQIAHVVRRHGKGQPIWLAEVGYSSFRKGDYVSDIYQAQFPFEHTEAFQAISVARAITQAAATGNTSLIAWYRIHDLPEKQDIIGDVNNRHLGVLAESNRPKPALTTLTFFHSLFSSEVRCIDSAVRVTRLVQTDAEVHAFEKVDGAVFVVAWMTAIPRRGDVRFASSSRRAEDFDVSLPIGASRVADVYNHLGQTTGRAVAENSAHSITLKNIEIHDGELKIFVLRPTPRIAERQNAK